MVGSSEVWILQHNQGGTVGSASRNQHQTLAAHEFSEHLNRKRVRIALLQDISVHFRAPRGYHLFSHPDGAAGVLVHEALQAAPILSQNVSSSCFSAVVVDVCFPGTPHTLRVASVYRKDFGQEETSVQEMHQWFDDCLVRWWDKAFVIGGDVNVRHQNFGCCHHDESNKAGRTLAELLSRHAHVRLLNDGSATRAAHLLSSRMGAPSSLDVTIANEQSGITFGRWQRQI